MVPYLFGGNYHITIEGYRVPLRGLTLLHAHMNTTNTKDVARPGFQVNLPECSLENAYHNTIRYNISYCGAQSMLTEYPSSIFHLELYSMF